MFKNNYLTESSPPHSDPAPCGLPRSWLIVPLALLVALPAMELTRIDYTFSTWFYDSTIHTFPLRETFLMDTVLHYWTKYAVLLLIFMLAGMLCLSFLEQELRPRRRLLMFLVLAMTLAPLAVTILKTFTDRPCPWDLVDFGGTTPYTHLFDSRGASHAPGRCFPAGHAATGFSLLAFFFTAHYERRRIKARIALVAGLLAGLLLGLGRIAQGAHFVSHVLWSGLVCWIVMVGIYALLMQPGKQTAFAKTV